MSDIRAAVIQAIDDFVCGRSDADTFVEAYSRLWQRIRQQQTQALASTPDSAAAVQQARLDAAAGRISPEEYVQRVRHAYAALPPMAIAPGTPVDELLSHLFVEANAYESDPQAREPYQIDSAALLEEARKVLAGLRA